MYQERPKGLKRIIFDMTHLTSLLQDIGAIKLTDDEVDKYYEIKQKQKAGKDYFKLEVKL